MDEDRGDHITLREFERGLAGVGIRPMPTTEELRLLFKSLDGDHDHTISYKELIRALETEHGATRRFGDTPAEAAAKRAEAQKRERAAERARESAEAEAERDRAAQRFGSVDALRRELRRKHLATGLVFNFMDADRGDSIGFSEFQRGLAGVGLRPLPPEPAMRALFDSFDRSGDGLISYREFVASLGGDGESPPAAAASSGGGAVQAAARAADERKRLRGEPVPAYAATDPLAAARERRRTDPAAQAAAARQEEQARRRRAAAAESLDARRRAKEEQGERLGSLEGAGALLDELRARFRDRRDFFDWLDHDRSGGIGFDEFCRGVSHARGGMPSGDVLRDLFKLTAGADGRIDPGELRRAFEGEGLAVLLKTKN
jgi:Ca2+-binding EF-hand superfamily protein